MRKKALRKDFYMEIKKSYARFLSIFLIVALGVAFFSGIRATKPDMQLSADKFYDEGNLMDLRILSTLGLTKADVETIRAVKGVQEVMPAYSVDVVHQTEDTQYILKLLSLPDTINQVTVTSGTMPQSDKECLIDSQLVEEYGYSIGDTITVESGDSTDITGTLKNTQFTVVGTGVTPYYLSLERGASEIGSGIVNGFVMIKQTNFSLEAFTEVYATVEGAKELVSYQKDYRDKVETVVASVKDIAIPEWYVLDRESLQTYVEFGQNADRIGAIGEVFPLIFFLVAALISLTTMTRMVEEERTQIGTLKALGYGKVSIATKYLLYAFLASIGGGILGAFVGQQVFPYVIIDSYTILYNNLPYILTPINLFYTLTSILAVSSCTVLAALFACYTELVQSAAQLMRPAAPKAGKRVLLERIPFIWKRLNFTMKSSIRNLVRYKKRFFMTVFGIAGCMALLLVGFGLKDSIVAISSNQYETISIYNGIISLKEGASETEKETLTNYISNMDNISDYLPAYETTLDIQNGTKEESLSLVVPMDNEQFSRFVSIRNRESKATYSPSLKGNGVILTEKVANIIGVKVGDTFYINQDETKQIKVKVEAIAENYLWHYLYMSKEMYQSLFKEEAVPNNIYFLEKNSDKDLETELGKEILNKEAAANVMFTSASSEDTLDMLESLNVVVYVLITAAGLLAFVVLYNLNNININERKRELATIKVLGFYNTELAAYVYRENLMLTVIGTIAGAFFGIILHHYVILTVEIDMLMFGREISAMSFLYGIILTFFFSIFVNFVMYFKLRKIDMVESLKSIE